MAYVEIDSFVGKFNHLLSSGIQATLKLSSCDGDANIVLEAKLSCKSHLCNVMNVHQRCKVLEEIIVDSLTKEDKNIVREILRSRQKIQRILR